MVVFFDIDGTLVDYKYAEKAGAIQFYREHVEVFKSHTGYMPKKGPAFV